MNRNSIFLVLLVVFFPLNCFADAHMDRQEFQKASDNLHLTLTQARAVPYFRSGKQIGLRIFYITEGSIYERMGLKNNDIVLEIDSKPYGDVLSTITSLLTFTKEAKEKIIKIDRDQKNVTLKVVLD